jgi:hypothetical protein
MGAPTPTPLPDDGVAGATVNAVLDNNVTTAYSEYSPEVPMLREYYMHAARVLQEYCKREYYKSTASESTTRVLQARVLQEYCKREYCKNTASENAARVLQARMLQEYCKSAVPPCCFVPCSSFWAADSWLAVGCMTAGTWLLVLGCWYLTVLLSLPCCRPCCRPCSCFLRVALSTRYPDSLPILSDNFVAVRIGRVHRTAW